MFSWDEINDAKALFMIDDWFPESQKGEKAGGKLKLLDAELREFIAWSHRQKGWPSPPGHLYPREYQDIREWYSGFDGPGRHEPAGKGPDNAAQKGKGPGAPAEEEDPWVLPPRQPRTATAQGERTQRRYRDPINTTPIGPGVQSAPDYSRVGYWRDHSFMGERALQRGIARVENEPMEPAVPDRYTTDSSYNDPEPGAEPEAAPSEAGGEAAPRGQARGPELRR